MECNPPIPRVVRWERDTFSCPFRGTSRSRGDRINAEHRRDLSRFMIGYPIVFISGFSRRKLIVCTLLGHMQFDGVAHGLITCCGFPTPFNTSKTNPSQKQSTRID